MSNIENPEKFADKFKLKSSRLKNWDYSSHGYYFITIKTLNDNKFFGKIINKKMELSKIGKIVFDFWFKILKHFLNISLDEFCIMPNHIHGILNIHDIYLCRDAINRVSTIDINSLIKTGGITGNYNPMLKNNSISSIIRWYKAKCTFEIRQNNLFFVWQSRFYDHIIQSEKELNNIRQYIKNNPKNWDK